MVKKSIIAIALMAMLATVSYGQITGGDQPYTPGAEGQIKIDGLWPATFSWTYTPIEICRIPIYIKVGMFIEIIDCGKKEIIMEQIGCTKSSDFPCYKGCVTIGIRSNFDAKLSLQLYKEGNIINGNNWKAYFVPVGGGASSNTFLVTGNGNEQNVQVCVEAWAANIYASTPNSKVPVGEVAILAVPTAAPDFCDYFDCD